MVREYVVYWFAFRLSLVTYLLIWQYKLKRCSKKECCKQCRYVKFKGTVTKWPVQKPTQDMSVRLYKNQHTERQLKHVEHHDATYI